MQLIHLLVSRRCLLLPAAPVEDRMKAEVPEGEKLDQVDRGVKEPIEVREVPVEGEVKVLISQVLYVRATSGSIE